MSNFIQNQQEIFSVPVLQFQNIPDISNETLKLKAAISKIDSGTNKIVNVNRISQEFNVKRRSLYDFLSVASLFGICTKTMNDTFFWNGFTHLQAKIQEIYDEFDSKNGFKSVSQLFNINFSSSLQSLAFNIVILFHYQKVDTIDLREVAKLWQGTGKYKTMLRKLYTVSACLEVARIIEKTNKVAEIMLSLRLNPSEKTQISSIGHANPFPLPPIYSQPVVLQILPVQNTIPTLPSLSCPSFVLPPATELLKVNSY